MISNLYWYHLINRGIISAVSLTQDRKVDLAQQRPPTRTKSTLPARPVSRPTQNGAPPRPHTVAGTRPRTISTAKKWHYGRPPPVEAHAAVIDWNKAKQIRAPIMCRRERVSSAGKKENAEHTEVSVLQPYPMNYNTFLVQSLRKDMSSLYTPSPDLIIRPASSKSAQESTDEEEDDEENGDNISVQTYWKMTWNNCEKYWKWNYILVAWI